MRVFWLLLWNALFSRRREREEQIESLRPAVDRLHHEANELHDVVQRLKRKDAALATLFRRMREDP